MPISASPVTQNVGQGVSSANQTATITATTAGNFVIAFYARSGGLSTGGLTSVTDSASQTWSNLTIGAVSGGVNTRIEAWYIANSASITSVTFNSATAQTNSWNITEWSGVASASPADVESPNPSGNASSTTQATPSITTTNASDLVIAALHFGQTTTTDPSSPWNLLTNFDDAAVGSSRAAYQVVSSTGSYNATWTLAVAKAAGTVTVSLIAATTQDDPTTVGPSVFMNLAPGFMKPTSIFWPTSWNATGQNAFFSGATEAITDTITTSGVVGVNTGATLAVTASIAAAGVVGVNTGAVVSITDTITTAGSVGTPGSLNGTATLSITDTITATGAVGKSAGAVVAVTNTITAAGLATAVAGASVATTATITSAGKVAAVGTASVTISATIAATGVVGKRTSAAVVTTATISALGPSLTQSAALAVSAIISAGGSAGVSQYPANVNLVATLTASGVVHGTNYILTPGTTSYNEELDHPGSAKTIFVKDNYLRVGTTILRISGSYIQTDGARDEDIAAATEVYSGGRAYILTPQQHTDLVAAGFGAFIQSVTF